MQVVGLHCVSKEKNISSNISKRVSEVMNIRSKGTSSDVEVKGILNYNVLIDNDNLRATKRYLVIVQQR